MLRTYDLVQGDSDKAHISDTLHEALNGFRTNGRTQALWIDQICINQQDNNEKAIQVGRMMSNMYCYAFQLVIWSGSQDENSHQAISTIRGAYKQVTATSPNIARPNLANANIMLDEQGHLAIARWRQVIDFFSG
jgi:hypothetical protein